MNVGTLCKRRVVAIAKSAPLSDVANLMSSQRVGAVVIVGDGGAAPRVVGIITDRDIVRAQLERTADLTAVSAGEAMTPDPLVLAEEDPIDGAIAHLRARGVRRAPVVSQTGSLVGLISIDDLLEHLAETLAGLARTVTKQVQRERA